MISAAIGLALHLGAATGVLLGATAIARRELGTSAPFRSGPFERGLAILAPRARGVASLLLDLARTLDVVSTPEVRSAAVLGKSPCAEFDVLRYPAVVLMIEFDRQER